jgi:hypothetical protein
VLSHVVWEAIDPGAQQGSRPLQVCLRGEQLSTLLDQNEVSPGGLVLSQPTVFAGLPAGRTRVRVAGTDEFGYRVAGWAEVDTRRRPISLARTP